MTDEPLAVRVAERLVTLYPRPFRDEYGTDMVAFVRDQCRDEPAPRVCARLLADLAITLPKSHLEARMHRIPNPAMPLIYAALSLAGLLLAILGGTQIVMVAIGLSIASVGAVISVVAWRHVTPASARGLTSAWWKFLLAGPALIATVLVAAGAGVESWYLGMATVLVALALTGVGIVLGVVRLATRSHPISA